MKKLCFRVKRKFGERLRVLLIEQQLLDLAYPITHDEDYLYLPLQDPPDEKTQAAAQRITSEATIIEKSLKPRTQKPTNLAAIVANQIPLPYLGLLPHSFDIIGDIVIVELEKELKPFETTIGKAILALHPSVTSVYTKVGGVTGPYRLRPLELIAGEEKSQTEHHEFGIRLMVDVTQTYFSPRLSTEHNRIANLVQPNEVIVDMFTGVGPFALLIAKRHNATVYAIDINAAAIKCLRKSMTLNRLKGTVIPMVGDSRQLIQKHLANVANRIIMNLPHDAKEYLDAAVLALKPTVGILHFYGITADEENKIEALKNEIKGNIVALGREVNSVTGRIIRPVAPHWNQVVFDFNLTGIDN